MQTDPIGVSQNESNSYRYNNNGNMTLTDPTGLSPIIDIPEKRAILFPFYPPGAASNVLDVVDRRLNGTFTLPLSPDDFYLFLMLWSHVPLSLSKYDAIEQLNNENTNLAQAQAIGRAYGYARAAEFYTVFPNDTCTCIATQLLKKLDSPFYQEREKASKALRCLGACAIPAIRSAIKSGSLSAEVVSRIDPTLNQYNVPTSLPNLLEMIRAQLPATVADDLIKDIKQAYADMRDAQTDSGRDFSSCVEKLK